MEALVLPRSFGTRGPRSRPSCSIHCDSFGNRVACSNEITILTSYASRVACVCCGMLAVNNSKNRSHVLARAVVTHVGSRKGERSEVIIVADCE